MTSGIVCPYCHEALSKLNRELAKHVGPVRCTNQDCRCIFLVMPDKGPQTKQQVAGGEQ